LYGIVFLAVLALLLSLAVAVYRQAFTPVVRITLQADSLGNQLDPRADVKLRGLLVGEVRAVHADGTRATLDIALKPQYVPFVPADVHARLLPKTLFGEKYVDLVAPARSTARPIRAGDVITQDRTRVGIEVQQLMNDLLPLLQTVQPGELNATLSAFATALEGRGDRIGDNLTRVDAYLRRLNPHLPSLTQDIARFADVTQVYGDAAPDLMAVLRNTVTTSRTIVEKQDRLAAALRTTATTADTAQGFLNDNGDRLITLGRVSRPTLELFARYSPEYPCLLSGLVHEEQASEDAFRGGAMHITLEVVRPQGAYGPGEEPRYADRSGPNCRGLPHPQVPAPRVRLNDGTSSGGSDGGALPGGTAVSATAAEQRAVGSLVAPVMGVPADQVPAVTTLLFGPLARGTAVSVA
jgi:virulence factor Mce-like protein